MGLGTSHMTVTTLDKWIPEIWMSLIVAREENKVLANLVTTQEVGPGDQLNFPEVSSLSVTSVTEESAVTFQAPTEADVNLSLNRHYESSFAIGDKVNAQAKYNKAQQYGTKAGQALQDQIETDLAGLYSGLTQTQGTGHTALTEAILVRGIQYLDDAKAPQTERYFVCKPAAMNNLRQISRFTEYQTTGEGKAPMVGGQRGFVDNVFGVGVYMTTNIAQVAGTPGIIHNLLFHKSAFYLAVQKNINLEHQRRPDYLADVYVASALWGYVEARDDHAVDIRTVIQS